MTLTEKILKRRHEKPHRIFKRIIQYCNLMGYDINKILDMSDYELKLWYDRAVEMTSNETNFRIRTGMVLNEKNGKL